MIKRNPNLLALAAGAVLMVLPAGASAQRTVALPAQDRALAGSPENVFRVGVEEGEPEEVFSNIAGVGFDGAGNLFVLDRENGRVVVFDATGKYVRTIGSQGQGPGEFNFPVGLAVFPDGGIAVMDLGNGAISLFDPNGEYRDIVRPAPGTVDVRPEMALRASTSASILMAGTQMARMPGGMPQISDSLPIVRVYTTGDQSTKVVYRTFNQGPRMQTSGSANSQEVRLSPPPEFSPQASWAGLADGGVAVSPGLNYEIAVVGPMGAPRLTITRPIRPRAVTDRDRDLVREQRREQLESGAGMLSVREENGRRTFSAGGRGMPRQQVEQMLANMQFAETVPVVRQLGVDGQGNLWVQRDGGPGSDEYPIDIISPSGEYRGTVKAIEMPDAFGPSGLAAFIESDDLGVQRVAVRRLPRSWR